MDTILAYLLDPSRIVKTIIGGGFGFFILLTIVLLILDYLGKVRNKNDYVRAVPASAKVIKISRSIGRGTYGGLIVNITLEVIPTDAAPYQVKNTWCFEPLGLPKVKAGDTIAIRIAPKHPREVYSGEPWAWNLGKQLPPRFGNRVPFFYIDR